MNGGQIGFGCARSYNSFCYSEACGETTEMYIEQAYRRKGAATALLNLLEKELSRRSVVSVRILTGSNNHSALRPYENNGYSRDNEAVLTKKLL
ncbi:MULTISPECIES: GNAT family N-acetyltransferase [unclassified Paenibacillus]|uniref:GNAT family N-acetyltransferase n=1 Tax=unclassified Paenibacillus TaxID=185978 RepID=UPI002405EC17|nr:MULTISPECIES: GNAT family N-acetyltransferase [unclassified Paenibacillus]MDF9844792.1 GNAT superfamily N-acetyltransferase [Paenibacillus sp. PastF-2]MDF9851407.1 GNAT superfamily N-acetyltransferase [Paenibacillus sp. PastM-2]MDF9857976.1 GNAT superfamily N-acetyltransferase [Paenibacillus sp. PastF-1]MDH6483244.1 GNAT superfamily N-acetyltransferase [Paenibacillus sp. PastH-2]MDH6510654.1 GNAT superfamily N-acetyltransferase [Paenibacillus sp. PastM-3]